MVSFLRIIKFALQDFFRNFWLSLITITILVLLLLSVNVLIVLNLLTDNVMSMIHERIDVSVYIKPSADDTEALAFKAMLDGMDEVKETVFISRDQALKDFKDKHKDDPKIIESLDEIGKNPLGATLVIKANKPSDYANILSRIEGSSYNDIINDMNYDDHKIIINRLDSIAEKVKTFMFYLSGFFAVIAGIIVFNTIRVAIYTQRDAIGIMKLVGASNWFVKMPFVAQSAIYAVVAGALIIAIFYPALILIQPYLSSFFDTADINILAYFHDNFALVFGKQMGYVLALNVAASFIAIGRYLRV